MIQIFILSITDVRLQQMKPTDTYVSCTFSSARIAQAISSCFH